MLSLNRLQVAECYKVHVQGCNREHKRQDVQRTCFRSCELPLQFLCTRRHLSACIVCGHVQPFCLRLCSSSRLSGCGSRTRQLKACVHALLIVANMAQLNATLGMLGSSHGATLKQAGKVYDVCCESWETFHCTGMFHNAAQLRLIQCGGTSPWPCAQSSVSSTSQTLMIRRSRQPNSVFLRDDVPAKNTEIHTHTHTLSLSLSLSPAFFFWFTGM